MMSAKWWFERYCSKKLKNINGDPTYEQLAESAANLSYRSSVQRAVKFNDRNSEKNLARKNGEMIIRDFLIEIYNCSFSASLNTISDIWIKIYNIYKDNNIEDYTYGNAQKWVNMSI